MPTYIAIFTTGINFEDFFYRNSFKMSSTLKAKTFFSKRKFVPIRVDPLEKMVELLPLKP